jgi:hypothetical protein
MNKPSLTLEIPLYIGKRDMVEEIRMIPPNQRRK